MEPGLVGETTADRELGPDEVLKTWTGAGVNSPRPGGTGLEKKKTLRNNGKSGSRNMWEKRQCLLIPTIQGR